MNADQKRTDIKKVEKTPFKELLKQNKKLIGWTAGALLAGGMMGITGYNSVQNQVVFSGSGLSMTKASMTDKIMGSSSNVLFTIAKTNALQKLYPEDTLKSDADAKKAGDELIKTYIKNNGGEASLKKTLEAQGTTLDKWKKMAATQAVAEAKSAAQQKQAVKVVKEAGIVSKDDINKAVGSYVAYDTNAYLVKDEDAANKVAGQLRNKETVAADDYTRYQSDLTVASTDANADASTTLSKLKDSKKGDVVVVQSTSGSGYYVFQVKDSANYADYKKDNNKSKMKAVRSTVEDALTQQAAQSQASLGKAEAKVFKKHNLHFKSKSLDKEFYDSLTNTSATTTTTTTSN